MDISTLVFFQFDPFPKGGICENSWLDLLTGFYPTSATPCFFWPPNTQAIVPGFGLCSDETRALLQDQENCIRPIYSQTYSITFTIERLILSMCDFYVTFINFFPSTGRRRRQLDFESQVNARLNPIRVVQELGDVPLATVPPLRTLH